MALRPWRFKSSPGHHIQKPRSAMIGAFSFPAQKTGKLPASNSLSARRHNLPSAPSAFPKSSSINGCGSAFRFCGIRLPTFYPLLSNGQSAAWVIQDAANITPTNSATLLTTTRAPLPARHRCRRRFWQSASGSKPADTEIARQNTRKYIQNTQNTKKNTEIYI